METLFATFRVLRSSLACLSKEAGAERGRCALELVAQSMIHPCVMSAFGYMKMLVWLFGSNQRSYTRHHLPDTEQVGHVPETVSGTVSRGVWSAVEGVDSDSS